MAQVQHAVPISPSPEPLVIHPIVIQGTSLDGPAVYQSPQRQGFGGFNGPAQNVGQIGSVLSERRTVVPRTISVQNPPRGAPEGGIWRVESFWGCTSLMICLLCVPTLCCPCDERRVYIDPNGKKWIMPGGGSICPCFC